MNLSKWNPFKFRRDREDQKAIPVVRHEHQAAENRASLAHPPGADPWRLMMDLWRAPFPSMATMDRWFGDFSPVSFTPSVDVVDDGAALRISVELPGMDKNDIEVSLEDGALTLRGQKKHDRSYDEDGCYRIERAHGWFQRSIPLPSEVEVDRAEATFDKGVLQVKIPKRETAQRGRRLPIN